jgi:ubiquinone/menaquinone biosynthesis C-methylase UbiE
MERRVFGEARKRLLTEARGRVLEVGAGTGVNFPLYRNATVVTLDPELGMLSQSYRRSPEVPLVRLAAMAEELPFPDGSFDAVVATLVFCTIPDPVEAMREVRRVLRAGGKLLLLEHVRSTSGLVGLIQDVMTPLQKAVAAGCHLNRRTRSLVEDVGFVIDESRESFASSIVEIKATKV